VWRERGKTETWVYTWECSTFFTGLTTNLSQDVDTAKAHVIPYGMREQAAVLPCDLLVEWLIREDFKKAAVASSCYMSLGDKGTFILSNAQIFCGISTDS
jgi:hypothetical protein